MSSTYAPAVLIVDDDPAITRYMRQQFHAATSVGVLVANDLGEAKRILDDPEISIDAIISDLNFAAANQAPESGLNDGLDILQYSKAQRNELRRYVLSFFADRPQEHDRAEEQHLDIKRWLPKMYYADRSDPKTPWAILEEDLVNDRMALDSLESPALIRTYIQSLADGSVECKMPIEVVCTRDEKGNFRSRAVSNGAFQDGVGATVDESIHDLEHNILQYFRSQRTFEASTRRHARVVRDELEKEALDQLEKKKRDVLSSAEKFKDHPVVKSLLQIVEEYSRESHTAQISRSTGAPEAETEQQAQIIDQLQRLCEALNAEPEFGNAFPRNLAKFVRPLEWPRCRCARDLLLDEVSREVIGSRPVVLVAPVGSGRRTLARSVAKQVFRESARTALFPIRMLVPNHLEMSRSGREGGYKEALLGILAELSASRMNVLAIPEIHHCVEDSSAPHELVEAWRLVFPSLIESGLPLLAWTTPSGFETLREVWPGLLVRARALELPTLPDATLLEVIRERLNELSEDRQLTFEDGFADELLARRSEWRTVAPVAEPGRVLDMIEQVLDTPWRGECPTRERLSSSHFLALKTRLERLVSRERFAEAKKLIRKIERLERRPTVSTPPPPRVVGSAQIDAFLRCQQCQ